MSETKCRSVLIWYESPVVGEGFLEHPDNNPAQYFTNPDLIFNLPARDLAKGVLRDGKKRQLGMWQVFPAPIAPEDLLDDIQETARQLEITTNSAARIKQSDGKDEQ